MKTIVFGAALAAASVQAQTPDSTRNLTVSGYAEVYYAHDFTAPKTTQERPGFLYNHKRNREVNVNLAFLKAAYTADRVRANLALMVGTYAQYNLAAEQELVKTVFEANAGVNLAKSRELWLDAGIFASHLGFESAISKDSWTLTRSLVAENSPYYLAGAKLTYTSPNGRWVLLGGVFNGWQRVKRLNGYSGASFGTQIQFKPSSKVTLNWSTFFGSDRPDSLRQGRIYHNFYGIFQSGKLGLILGFDLGADDRTRVLNGRREKTGNDRWYTPVAIVRYTASERVNLAGRVEYFNDPDGVIIAASTPSGFKTWGYSANFDYAITPQALFRIEGRVFNSRDAIFESGRRSASTTPSRTNAVLTTSLAVAF